MTVLVAGISLVLCLVLSMGVSRVGEVIAERTRAQTAADAAALAAAAESALGGGQDPKGQATRFARLNGAVLEECLCVPGATAAQVRVRIGLASASARAVFDAARALPVGIAPGRLHPVLEASLARLAEASGNRVFVVSGARSFEEQSALWEEALQEHGSPEIADDWVARPGTSMHERGLAVDLGGDLDLARDLIERLRLPLVASLSHEPWHFELRL